MGATQKTVDQENEIARAAVETRLRDEARILREVFNGPRGRLALDIIKRKFNWRAGMPAKILDKHDRVDDSASWFDAGQQSVLQYIHIKITSEESASHVNPSGGST